MRSISSRLIIGTSIVLAVFVVLTALSVSWSVHRRAETARLDRMQGLVYGILGATEIADPAELVVNELELPDIRLNQPSVGLYAEIIGYDGSRLWQSRSSATSLPAVDIRPIGDWLFETVSSNNTEAVHRLQFSTAWAFENGEELPFTVHIVDEADSLLAQLKRFDQTLWATLLGSAALLLLLQLWVLKKSLAPLRQIGDEVHQVESGERDSLSEQVPRELQSLSSGLNALLGAERQRHAQYRHLLDDLAHSLKTPLSVLRNVAERTDNAIPEQNILNQQISTIQTSIERYVQRANIRAPVTLRH